MQFEFSLGLGWSLQPRQKKTSSHCGLTHRRGTRGRTSEALEPMAKRGSKGSLRVSSEAVKWWCGYEKLSKEFEQAANETLLPSRATRCGSTGTGSTSKSARPRRARGTAT